MMAAMANGTANGVTNGDQLVRPVSTRFSDIPSAIDIPVQGDQEDEAVEIDLEDLLDDPTELCTLFENERAAKTYWMTVALAYAKQKKIDHAIEMLIRGSGAIQSSNPRDKVSMICCLCWMYLWKSREAPRVAPDGVRVSEAKTKEYYLQLGHFIIERRCPTEPVVSAHLLGPWCPIALAGIVAGPFKDGRRNRVREE
ncbi:protein required for normal CLN1 and CLN2 G1 cyclin expression [Metarhizium acridum]|uniref:protein required for normal CLN1 and CLN2 G1 cyclin expression n=1 Tax=Metarhizium acridum TaxID=92637 RepID=UPI001C6B7188|nr:protein required for normal CLN1 and CLN2 G1 cyclin expression [Metarhizium acridum]